ncbi:MAG: hypothetical protein JSW32_00195 [Deltaproteobacteria bacterium]|nr:MAG: hypothetical protein JSW32_00195 [Deltaproteobacteria bacterium]
MLLSWEEVDLALWDSREGATIVVNVNPLRRDLDLSNLTRHLLIAFERKKIISQDPTKVNGREALRTVLEGWAEGTEVKVEAYVVKGNGVVYDILFWSPLDVFSRKVETFHQFLAGLNFLRPEGLH